MNRSSVANTRAHFTMEARPLPVSNVRPAAALVAILVTGFACCALCRPKPVDSRAAARSLVPGGLTQRDAIRQSGDIVTDTMPWVARVMLSVDGLALESGRGASWDVTCTDAHGVDRASIVWNAVSGQIVSYGSIEDGRAGGRVSTERQARRFSDRWLNRLSQYGWPHSWKLQSIGMLKEPVWKAYYKAPNADAYVLIDARTSRLMQAHFSDLRPKWPRGNPKLCSYSP